MKDTLQVSVIVYTLTYPERAERCIESLKRQTNIQTDIRLLVDEKAYPKRIRQFPQIKEKNIYALSQKGISEGIAKALQDCLYENITFVSSDSVLEGDTLERLLVSEGTADGLVFNLSIVRDALKCKKLYPDGFITEDIFTKKELYLPDQDKYFSAANIYKTSPGIWNHLYKKSIIQQHKIQLEDFTRISQYYFLVKYHSCCSSLAVNTSLYVYREQQGKKMKPNAGFCMRHYFEINSMLRRAYKKYTPETMAILSDDFKVTLRQAETAVREKKTKSKR